MARSAEVVSLRSSRGTRLDPRELRAYIFSVACECWPQMVQSILPHSRKARALLAYLCLCERTRASRNRLTGLLWGNSSEPQARMSLRHALLEFNRDVNAKVPGLIEIDRETVGLNARACWIDIQAEPDRTEQLLTDLDGVSAAFDQWLASERARFEDRVRKKLEEDLEQLINTNAAPQARAEQARKLTNFDPTHEGAVRSLMMAFAEMGDRAQAIREYERCRQALKLRFDLVPSRETIAVYEAVRLVGYRPSLRPEHPVPAEDSGSSPIGRSQD